MARLFHTASSQPLPARLALEPVYNVLNSIALLNEAARLPALDAWVARTAAALAPEQRRANRLIFEALGAALLPDQEWPDFPSYLDDLAARRPQALRDRVLADAQANAAPLEGQHPVQHADAALQAEAEALLSDPPAMHDLIVSHLRTVWEMALAAEWQRVSAPLQKIVGIAQHRQAPEAATIAENLRAFVGRDALDDVDLLPSGVRQIIYVPSPHTGRHVTRLYHAATLRLFFHGPSNYAAVMRTSPVGRAELLARLSALADDTRLRILELCAGQGELSAQEIIAQLDLSQSSVSRHLKQLSPYLIERRGEGASKLYSLAPAQVDLTFRGLERVLAGAAVEELQIEPSGHPRELRRFLDEQGRVTALPAKRRDQLMVLEYLASQFELRRFYTEKEVNTILNRNLHSTTIDHAIVRRALCDYRFLDRERDGSRYWRASVD